MFNSYDNIVLSVLHSITVAGVRVAIGKLLPGKKDGNIVVVSNLL